MNDFVDCLNVGIKTLVSLQNFSNICFYLGFLTTCIYFHNISVLMAMTLEPPEVNSNLLSPLFYDSKIDSTS